MWETWVQSLGWEDPLEKGKATHSSILAWRLPWTVNSPWGRKESDTTERLSLSFLRKSVCVCVWQLWKKWHILFLSIRFWTAVFVFGNRYYLFVGVISCCCIYRFFFSCGNFSPFFLLFPSVSRGEKKQKPMIFSSAYFPPQQVE